MWKLTIALAFVALSACNYAPSGPGKPKTCAEARAHLMIEQDDWKQAKRTAARTPAARIFLPFSRRQWETAVRDFHKLCSSR